MAGIPAICYCLNCGTSFKFYTLYSPPHHKDGILRLTKQEAEANDPEFDGTTTE